MKIGFLVPDNRDEFKQYHLPEPVFGPAPTALLEGFSGLEGCEVHIVACGKRDIPAPKQLASNIFYHQELVPQIGWGRTLFYGCTKAIRRRLQAIGPDVVHGQGTEKYCGLAAAYSGFPSVLTIHGNMRLIAELKKSKPFSYTWVMARLEAHTLPRVGGVVAISSYTRKAVEKSTPRTWLLPNAVDGGSFLVPRKPVQPPVVLCSAHIEPRKNQIGLMRALDPLAAAFKFKLLFIGRPSPDAYKEEFKAEVARRDWCEYKGSLERAGVHELMSGSSLLILPSFEDNCPMVVLESMAAGLAVVAADVGGVPDLVQDGVNGLLCDPSSARSMASAVERLLREPALAEALAAKGLQHARERFAPKAVARRHLEIYRELLAGGSG